MPLTPSLAQSWSCLRVQHRKVAKENQLPGETSGKREWIWGLKTDNRESPCSTQKNHIGLLARPTKAACEEVRCPLPARSSLLHAVWESRWGKPMPHSVVLTPVPGCYLKLSLWEVERKWPALLQNSRQTFCIPGSWEYQKWLSPCQTHGG